MQFFTRGGVLILVMGVVFVNGWTDAPNAIATAVTTGAIPFRKAAGLCALLNCAGLVLMSLLNASVADTVTRLLDFNGQTAAASLAALCAAMLAVVIFAVGAWVFAIPTSESHALIAGVTGAALALGGKAAISPGAWGKVLAGLALSLLLGMSLGGAATRWLGGFLRRKKEKKLAQAQIGCMCVAAFLHGAQDGQKFLAILVMGECLSKGAVPGGSIRPLDHLPLLLLVGLTMALGTLVGGERIVKAVGSRMVHITPVQGICADLGSGACLLLASLTGIPMSTTHTKTAAIMGAGKAGGGQLDGKIVAGMLTAWAVTFPACGLIGYGLTRIMLRLLA